ncbi:MAG: ribbon-helix-helix domain-containing protein [Oscillospiraceae bacterium]|nr:ribbon-helix-helix domain-containing protein [Oscillospiraceae bacterium]
MATKLKRFTISITPEMEVDLDVVKKERYYKQTQSEMIRDLIVLGLREYNEDQPGEDAARPDCVASKTAENRDEKP